MKIALAQIASRADTDYNFAMVEQFSRSATQQGADLIVFPEYAMVDALELDAVFITHAEPLDGPFVSRVRDLACTLRVTIVFGVLEKLAEDERASNTLVAVGPAGEVVATYRKLHLYDAFGFEESLFIKPGATVGPATFDVAGARVGMLTCYDLRFPEAARQHADAGVDVLVYPSCWIPGPRKEDHWKTLARARAIENTMFVAPVSQAAPLGTGGSFLVDPMGLVCGELDGAVGMIVVEVDPQRVRDVRAIIPSLAHRRFTVVPAGVVA